MKRKTTRTKTDEVGGGSSRRRRPSPMTQIYNTARIAKDLRDEEGYRRFVYADGGGLATIAIGRCVAEGRGYGIDEEEAMWLLSRDIERIARDCEGAFNFWADITPNIRETLIMLVFQLGLAGTQRFSKMLRAISDGMFAESAMELLDSRFAKQTPARARRMASRLARG
jgi:lysozyme